MIAHHGERELARVIRQHLVLLLIEIGLETDLQSGP